MAVADKLKEEQLLLHLGRKQKKRDCRQNGKHKGRNLKGPSTAGQIHDHKNNGEKKKHRGNKSAYIREEPL